MESEVAATTRREAETQATYIGLKRRARRLKLNDESWSQSSQQQRSTEIKKKKSHKPTVDNKYSQWKTLVPTLYDSLSNHSLVWPSLSCRWGPQSSKNQQRLYLTEQTDGSVPNTLVVANCEAVRSQLNGEACSSFVKKYKTIIHPGVVNRIRELPQNSKIVATHTDSPDFKCQSCKYDILVFGFSFWDIESQPDWHAVLEAPRSRPDLDNAQFALAMFPTEPFVLSGGKKSVVLWSIQDHITTSGTDSKSPGSSIKQTGEDSNKTGGRSFGPRGHGNDDTVEDVAFCPSSA